MYLKNFNDRKNPEEEKLMAGKILKKLNYH